MPSPQEYNPDRSEFKKARERLKLELVILIKGNQKLSKYSNKIPSEHIEELALFLANLWERYQTSTKWDESKGSVNLSKMSKELKALEGLLEGKYPWLEIDSIVFVKNRRTTQKVVISHGLPKSIITNALASSVRLKKEIADSKKYTLKGAPKLQTSKVLERAAKNLHEYLEKDLPINFRYLNPNPFKELLISKSQKLSFVADLLSIVTEELAQKSVTSAHVKKYLSQ